MELESIIEGCRKGDVVMQKQLYDRYSKKFYMLCRRYSRDDSTAQEVLCDGFLTIFDQIDSYRGDGSFEGWMRTIVLRCATRRYRLDKRRTEMQANDDDMQVPYDDNDHGERMDVRDAMVRAMRKLSDVDRQIFNLVAVEGYKFEDASLLMGENISTLKTRYYKTLQRMRTLLAGYLGKEYIH